MTKPALALKCPSCKTEVHWTDDFPHRPFCSHRCKLIDLGSWSSEEYSIACQEQDEWALNSAIDGDKKTPLQ